MTTSYRNTPPAYPAPGPDGSPPAARHGAGMATAALVLGVLGLVTCLTVVGGVVLGLLAAVLGVVAARRASRGAAPGRGRAIAGIATGVIGLIVSVVIVIAGVSLLNSPKVKDLTSCLQQAGNDRGAQQKCQQDYANAQ